MTRAGWILCAYYRGALWALQLTASRIFQLCSTCYLLIVCMRWAGFSFVFFITITLRSCKMADTLHALLVSTLTRTAFNELADGSLLDEFSLDYHMFT